MTSKYNPGPKQLEQRHLEALRDLKIYKEQTEDLKLSITIQDSKIKELEILLDAYRKNNYDYNVKWVTAENTNIQLRRELKELKGGE